MRGESFAPGFDTQTLLAAIFLFSTVVYSCVRTSGKSSSLSIQSDDASIEEVLLVEEDKDGVSARFFFNHCLQYTSPCFKWETPIRREFNCLYKDMPINTLHSLGAPWYSGHGLRLLHRRSRFDSNPRERR